jgi:hypothetical protein
MTTCVALLRNDFGYEKSYCRLQAYSPPWLLLR